MAGGASMNHLRVSTSWILRLGSYHWHNSKTVEWLKLKFNGNYIKYESNGDTYFE